MSTIGKLLLSPITLVADAVFGKPKSKAQTGTPVAPTPAPARDPGALRESLFGREGTRANRRTGPGGAEAGDGKKTKMGQ